MRSLFIAAAVGGMVVLFACSSTETKYQRGQVWSYKASASTDSHITVLDVHRDAQYGEVVFIAMDGLNISTSDGLEIHAVHSIPFDRAALDLSVAALLRTGQGHESVRPADIEGVPYEEWKQMRGKAQTSTVADFLSSLRHLKGPTLRYDSPPPDWHSPS